MNVNWRTLLIKASIWLVAEIILNLVGLDNLADYSEFAFGHDSVADALNPNDAIALIAQPSNITVILA
jgi:hypothetical protein